MPALLSLTLGLASLAPPSPSPSPAPAAAELRLLLDDFLAGASRNDLATHERFWSDDVVYTGSGGRRRGKTEILDDVRATPSRAPGAPVTTFTAEDVRIRQYGETAVVAFRLVATTEGSGRTEVTHYLNTGTFVRRDGRWQAVAWQATKAAETADEAVPSPQPSPR